MLEHSVRGSNPARQWQMPEDLGRRGPRKPLTFLAQEAFGLFSLTWLCRRLGRDACRWGVEWEELCLAPRGAAQIYGAGFLQAGERPQAGAMEPD